MKIPFVDIARGTREIESGLFDALQNVIARSAFILGEEVGEFEKRFAEFCEAPFCVGVASGTDALHLACRALDIGPGDEVIVPVNTYIATALCVTYTGATPVFVDCAESGYCIDTDQMEKAVTPRTRAVIPVHMYGQCADMDKIRSLSEKHGLKIIEDASHAHGARYKGKPAGTLGDIACFSLYPGKNLGAFGDAGCMTTQDPALYEKLLLLRNYGSPTKYLHDIVGFNSRLDTLQACVLLLKLKKMRGWNARRQKIAAKYGEILSRYGEIIAPKVLEGREHVFHLYVCRHGNRDALLKYFKNKGIEILIHYPIPIHLQKAYSSLGYRKGDFPVAERLAGDIFSLPIFPQIKEEEIEYIERTLAGFLGK